MTSRSESLRMLLPISVPRTSETSALNNEYVGPSIAALGMKYCVDGQYPKVDFDLALKQLEESKFVNTAQWRRITTHRVRTLGSLAVFSKREFVYLTEKGYMAFQNPLPNEGRKRQGGKNT